MKLGKTAPKFNSKTLEFSTYVDNALPAPSSRVFREYKTFEAAKQLFGNDKYGDCVWAMIANYIILATSHTGTVVIPTLDDVLKGYSAVTGFDPVTGANDNGTALTDALDYMRTTGMAGIKFLTWAKIDHTNLVHRRLGVDLFGATMVGVQLPAVAQEQFGNNRNWEVVADDGGIEGGHAILHPGYGSMGGDYVSWARWDQKAGLPWEAQYIDEEYVVVTDIWLDKVTQKTPGGIDLPLLLADLKAISA